MEKCSGERAFFKLLHSEFRKATIFFGKTFQELVQKEVEVRKGLEDLKAASSSSPSRMDYETYSKVAKNIYLLHRDELLLELYAIMSYISFSKILKKHDKNTGYETSAAFLTNMVNKANFTHYPELTNMIQRSEEMFESFLQEIPEDGHKMLGDNERLFISMIHRFYRQILDETGKHVQPDAVPLLRRRSEHGESEHSRTSMEE